jgi:hypothetical protein
VANYRRIARRKARKYGVPETVFVRQIRQESVTTLGQAIEANTAAMSWGRRNAYHSKCSTSTIHGAPTHTEFGEIVGGDGPGTIGKVLAKPDGGIFDPKSRCLSTSLTVVPFTRPTGPATVALFDEPARVCFVERVPDMAVGSGGESFAREVVELGVLTTMSNDVEQFKVVRIDTAPVPTMVMDLQISNGSSECFVNRSMSKPLAETPVARVVSASGPAPTLTIQLYAGGEF